MELRVICDLMDKFEHSGLARMKLEMEGMKLELEKDAILQRKEAVNGQEIWRTEKISETCREQKNGQAAAADKDLEVKAPLAGTFYAAPAPQEAPYVTVGKKVAKGEVIGIIEAMKMMNEITAPSDGEVTAVKTADGEMAEYGQVLMTIKES